jgi:lycopene beta-cyclase
MDATTVQDDGYRFFYTLPFDKHTVLIEDTHYSDAPDIATDAYGNEIHRYAHDQGWRIRKVLREEEGVLPITLGGDLDAFWDNSGDRVPRSGLRAALFHPATGYSLPCAVRAAEALAEVTDWNPESVYQCTRGLSEQLWDETRFYRILNRMLFLAAEPRARRIVLERFYGLDELLIARFYAGTNTWFDKARILLGKPPVPLARAYSAVFRYQPSAG